MFYCFSLHIDANSPDVTEKSVNGLAPYETALNDKEVAFFKKRSFISLGVDHLPFVRGGMGVQFFCVRIFFRKPLETDNGARFFPALYVMRDIFFLLQDIFRQVIPCNIFFPSKSASRIIFF